MHTSTTVQGSVTKTSELPAWTAPTLTELHLATNTLGMFQTDADAGANANNSADS